MGVIGTNLANELGHHLVAAHLIEGQLRVLNAALLGSPAPVKVIERGTVHLATRILKLRCAAICCVCAV